MSENQIIGAPLPKDVHALSVSLPTWASVVGYEEGDPKIFNLLSTGYPRFKIHLYHEILAKRLISELGESGTDGCFIWPSLHVAKRCEEFVKFNYNGNSNIFIKEILTTGLYAIYLPSELLSKAKLYWQHAGEVTSSRLLARALLAYNISPPPLRVKIGETFEIIEYNDIAINYNIYDELSNKIKTRIIESLDLNPVNTKDHTVTLTVSGMSAIFNTLRLVRKIKPIGKIVVFGFPYLDTLKIMNREEWNSEGCIFLGFGDNSDIDKLTDLLKDSNSTISAVFTEFPSNPLLNSHDLPRLSALAKEYDFILVVDDTISSFANVNLINSEGQVDVICSSLTKVFSGIGDAMAGSMVINPNSRYFESFRYILASNDLYIPPLANEDLIVLERNSREYIKRLYNTNANALELANRLKSDSRVQNVYYPGINPNKDLYKSLLRSNDRCGYGCLLSFVLKDNTKIKLFYDSLLVNKGPSLGTEFTLVCPYTLLAHYNELDWAEQFGVSRHIVRVSVGEENIEDIWLRFNNALDVISSTS